MEMFTKGGCKNKFGTAEIDKLKQERRKVEQGVEAKKEEIERL